jgi:AraC-like DNA-binding protein
MADDLEHISHARLEYRDGYRHTYLGEGRTQRSVVAEEPAPPHRDPRVSWVAGGLPGARLRRVTAYIDSNLHRELRLSEISAVVRMSPYYFARLFKRSTGVSPHLFVVRRRIERAAVLLATPGLSIRAIASAVGFKAPGHFATTFRRMTGMTPSARRMTRAGDELTQNQWGVDDPLDLQPDLIGRHPRPEVAEIALHRLALSSRHDSAFRTSAHRRILAEMESPPHQPAWIGI